MLVSLEVKSLPRRSEKDEGGGGPTLASREGQKWRGMGRITRADITLSTWLLST